MKTQRYRDVLSYEIGARVVVEFTTPTRKREVMDYAVVLTVDDGAGEAVTVRVYDGTHGVNDMHRHDRSGEKAPAEMFHAGTLGEGMRAAITAVRTGYKEVIDAWRAREPRRVAHRESDGPRNRPCDRGNRRIPSTPRSWTPTHPTPGTRSRAPSMSATPSCSSRLMGGSVSPQRCSPRVGRKEGCDMSAGQVHADVLIEAPARAVGADDRRREGIGGAGQRVVAALTAGLPVFTS